MRDIRKMTHVVCSAIHERGQAAVRPLGPLGLTIFWLSLLIMMSASPARHPPLLAAQEGPTATPDAEGIIYAIVQPGDSLWALAARAGIPLTDLLALNDLTTDSIIQPGDRLVMGRGMPPATTTAEPGLVTATATLPPPTATKTATASPPTAICLEAYDDLNRNGEREPEEPLKSGVTFTLYDSEVVLANYVTDGVSEPECIEGLGAGNYHVTRSVRPDETLSNQGDWAILLASGQVLQLQFGSYTSPGPGTPFVLDPDVETTEPATIEPQIVPAATAGTEDLSSGNRSGAGLRRFVGIAAVILLVLFLVVVITFRVRNGRADS